MYTTDKDLIRQGRYKEALGDNYREKAFYIIVWDSSKGIYKEDHEFQTVENEFFYTKEDAQLRCEELSIDDYFIGNLNADWL